MPSTGKHNVSARSKKSQALLTLGLLKNFQMLRVWLPTKHKKGKS